MSLWPPVWPAALLACTSAPIPLVLPIQRLSSATLCISWPHEQSPAYPQACPCASAAWPQWTHPRVGTPSSPSPQLPWDPFLPLLLWVRLVIFPLPSMRSPALGTFEVLGVLWSSPSGWPYPPGSLSYCLCDRDLYRVTCLTFFLLPSCHLPWIILIHFKVDEPILELLSSP